jgi:magnesium chelatase subunit I
LPPLWREHRRPARHAMTQPRRVFPFSAIVGQDEMKQALLIAAVDPRVGGVLVFGDRGTGKSTAVRALAACCRRCAWSAELPLRLRPRGPRRAVRGLRRRGGARPPESDFRAGAGGGFAARRHGGPGGRRAGSGAGADRGRKVLRAGPAGPRHRGFLYIDEVNLLEDHLVDLLLDVAASGENVVEREGLSVRHPGALRAGGQRQP